MNGGFECFVEVDLLARRPRIEVLAEEFERGVNDVGLNEQQLTGPNRAEGHLDALQGSAHLMHLGNAATGTKPFLEEGHDFALGTSAGVLIFIEEHAIECVGELPPLADHVAVSAVAGRGVHNGPVLVRELIEHVDQSLKRGRVVAIVQNDGRAVDLEQVEAAGNRLRISPEDCQGILDDLERNTKRPARRHRSEHVFHLEPNATASGERNVGQVRQRSFFGRRQPE